jgi:hypothetical protein
VDGVHAARDVDLVQDHVLVSSPPLSAKP